MIEFFISHGRFGFGLLRFLRCQSLAHNRIACKLFLHVFFFSFFCVVSLDSAAVRCYSEANTLGLSVWSAGSKKDLSASVARYFLVVKPFYVSN